MAQTDALGTSLDHLREHWDNLASRAQNDCARVDSSLRAQCMRFEAFLLFHDLREKSVLDVGCGTGGLYEHLAQRQIPCDYTGFDLSPQMIDRCRQRFPGARFEGGNFLEWRPGRQFDYTLAIGIHHVKVDDNQKMLERMTRRQFELCRVATHISLLTDRYQGFAPHIQRWCPAEVLNLALDMTPFVVLRHDYLPNDFSVTLYREPLIDTRKDLKLD